MHENQRALGTRIKHSAWDFCTFPPLPYRHGVIRQIRQLFGTAWTLATSHVLDIVSTCCFSFFFSSTYNFVLVACKSVRQTPWMRYASYPISKTARESVSSALKHHHSISKKKNWTFAERVSNMRLPESNCEPSVLFQTFGSLLKAKLVILHPRVN